MKHICTKLFVPGMGRTTDFFQRKVFTNSKITSNDSLDIKGFKQDFGSIRQMTFPTVLQLQLQTCCCGNKKSLRHDRYRRPLQKCRLAGQLKQ